jgi:hypothetical protein
MKKLMFLLFISSAVFSQQKINGISFVASNTSITSKAIEPVAAINANWVTLMPYGFMKTEFETIVTYNSELQWINERKEGIQASAKLFKQKKIKIMLKPQIWIPNGGFTGYIKMKSEKDWTIFEQNYENFILFYAKIAQDCKCELFCIGTEMGTFVADRPTFWKRLIPKIKKVYSSKITYAENWDVYQKVPFVSKLDFVGIDAYFPLSKSKTPTIQEIETAWKPIKSEMKSFASKHKKKILFTEFGYQSKDHATIEPWEHSKSRIINLKAQENALAAIFNQFWQEDWFAGGFLWKWYDNHADAGGASDSDYTIQNKPSEKIVSKQFAKN